MALPEFYKFMRPVLQMMSDGKLWRIGDLYKPAADYFSLTEAERSGFAPLCPRPNNIGTPFRTSEIERTK